ncbi:MAG TPA: glycosyltransferase family 4 protein [Ramlibacter sp.]|nr:glycosyltransferase family 4 protein [Ramlibacter sp.]
MTLPPPLSASFGVLPWPQARGGPQVNVSRFISAARQGRYTPLPLALTGEHQPCLLNVGSPKQDRLFNGKRRVAYRVAGLFLADHFQRLGEVYGDRTYRPEYEGANARIARTLEQSDFVIYQSRWAKGKLDTAYRREAGTWQIVPNAVSLSEFSPRPRTQVEIAHRPAVIGTVGSLRYRPRLETFFDVCRRLSERPRLLIVGDVDQWCAQALKKAQADPYWAGAITYVPSVPPDKLVEFYNRMDCLLHPIIGDACPNVVVEALACGTPVACAEEGGTSELIGRGGIAVPDATSTYNDAFRAGLAAAIERILAEAPRFRLEARRQAEMNNDIRISSAHYLEALGFPPYGPEKNWKHRGIKLLSSVFPRRDAQAVPAPARRPRIALVLWDWNLGGIASWMTRIARALPEFEFHFIATHLESHSPEIDEVGTFSHQPGFAGMVAYLRKWQFDIVQASNLRWPIDAAKIAGVPRVLERTDGTRSCCAVSKEDIDAVIVSAAGTAPFIRGFWPNSRLQVIYNSVDLRIADAATPLRVAPPGRFAIGRCSRFGGGKRLDILIEATAILLGRGLPVHLVLAGEDSRLKGAVPVEPALRELAQELGIEEHVTFLGRTTEPLRVFKGLDVALCSSNPYNEGIPNSLIEPMACGIPVVSTDIDQVDELVIGGENGFLVPPGNAPLFADAVERLLDPELRARMGRAARHTIETTFSFEKAAREYRTVYREMLTGNKEVLSTELPAR